MYNQISKGGKIKAYGSEIPLPYSRIPELQGKSFDQIIEQAEKDIFSAHGFKGYRDATAKIQAMNHAVEKARLTWACISAKSQRSKKTSTGYYYSVKCFENLTEIKPVYDDLSFQIPPSRQGEQINNFTNRSRQRFLGKVRRLQKSELPLPVFVTLTYHHNYTNFKGAKSHLNVFLQRYRRLGKEFAYFWKMEMQKRGAIHFHLAMFLPKKIRDLNIHQIRKRIQQDWGECTKSVDYQTVPVTRIKYINRYKKKRIYAFGEKYLTLCRGVNTIFQKQPDWEHLQYGTNVRTVGSWKEMIGYLGKYFKKPVDSCDFDGKTGRFWGFSYNLDFNALHEGCVYPEDETRVVQFSHTINTLAFRNLAEYLKERALDIRDDDSRPEWMKDKHLEKIRNIYEAQKRRYVVNKEKIEAGRTFQAEIPVKYSGRCFKYLASVPVNVFFT